MKAASLGQSSSHRVLAGAYRNAKVLVTGGAGFIGSHLVRELVREGSRVVAWTKPGSDSLRSAFLRNMEIEWEAVDLADSQQVWASLRRHRPEIVFHLAAIGTDGRERSVEEFVRGNVMPGIFLGQKSRETGFRLVVTGSMFELGASEKNQNEETSLCPANLYSWSKLALLQFYQVLPESDANWVWLRLFGVYGPLEAPQRVFAHVIRGLHLKSPVGLTLCKAVRDFIYVEDVVQALLAAGKTAHRREIFNIGAGKAWNLREILENFASKHSQPHLLRFGELPDRRSEVSPLASDSSKALRLLQWQARFSIEQGLDAYWKWSMTEEGKRFLQTHKGIDLANRGLHSEKFI